MVQIDVVQAVLLVVADVAVLVAAWSLGRSRGENDGYVKGKQYGSAAGYEYACNANRRAAAFAEKLAAIEAERAAEKPVADEFPEERSRDPWRRIPGGKWHRWHKKDFEIRQWCNDAPIAEEDVVMSASSDDPPEDECCKNCVGKLRREATQ